MESISWQRYLTWSLERRWGILNDWWANNICGDFQFMVKFGVESIELVLILACILFSCSRDNWYRHCSWVWGVTVMSHVCCGGQLGRIWGRLNVSHLWWWWMWWRLKEKKVCIAFFLKKAGVVVKEIPRQWKGAKQYYDKAFIVFIMTKFYSFMVPVIVS